MPAERCLHRRSRRSDGAQCAPPLLVPPQPASSRVRPHAHPQQSVSECYARLREYRGDIWTGRLFTGPLNSSPPSTVSSLRLRCVSGAAFYAAKASLIFSQTGETQQLLLLIVLHVDVHITTMWRLLQSCCCCWWIFSLILSASVLLWADCHPGKFRTLASQTPGSLVLMSDGMWLSLCCCRDGVNSNPLVEYPVTGHWLGIFPACWLDTLVRHRHVDGKQSERTIHATECPVLTHSMYSVII